MKVENVNNTNYKFSESDKQLRKMVDAYAAYSIKYVVDSNGNLEDVIIMLAGGGPNIWLDTHAREVQGFWGSTKYTKYIYDYEYIIDYWSEIYDCCVK